MGCLLGTSSPIGQPLGGLGFRLLGFGCKVLGLGFWVLGLGFRCIGVYIGVPSFWGATKCLAALQIASMRADIMCEIVESSCTFALNPKP